MRCAMIVHDYTREAGVRSLERQIGPVLRSAAVRVAEAKAGRSGSSGRPHRDPRRAALRERDGDAHQRARRGDRPGLDAGRRRYPVHRGNAIPGTGRLILTGQLGDVMKESAQAALSHRQEPRRGARHRCHPFEKNDIHVHVPAGATPKDGPSAGVAMFMALTSLMTDRTVRSDTAMTGEISLRGLVLPVGGIKEKVVAAARPASGASCCRRATGGTTTTSPRCAPGMEFIWLERVEEAVAAALEPERRRGARFRPQLAGAEA